MTAQTDRPDDDSSGIAERADREYHEALLQIARQIGVPPEDLSRRVEISAEELDFTPECLTLSEIDRFPSIDALPVERRQHVNNCSTCLEFLSAIEPSPEETADFAREAASRARKAERAEAWRFAWKPAFAGALMAVLVMLPYGWTAFSSAREEAVELRGLVQETESRAALIAQELEVARTLTDNDVSRSVSIELSLRQALFRNPDREAAEAAARSIIVGALETAGRGSFAGPADEDAMQATIAPVAVRYASRDVARRVLRSSQTIALQEPLYLERIYFDGAREACAQTPLAESLAGGFVALRHAAFESDDVRAWQAPYVQIHQLVESRLRPEPSATADGSTPAEASSELKLCDTYLERFASVRFGRASQSGAMVSVTALTASQ